MRCSKALVAALALQCCTALGACDRDKYALFVKLPADKVDKDHQEAAEQFGTDYFDNCGKGKCEEIGDEAITAVRLGFPVAKQKAAYDAWVQSYGEYQSLQYVEAIKITQGPEVVAFRFKGIFEKGQPEVRVVIDKDGKVAGFFVKPWLDQFN